MQPFPKDVNIVWVMRPDVHQLTTRWPRLFNSLKLSNVCVYIAMQIRSSLVQIMVSHLFDAKSLSESILDYQIGPGERISVKL